MERNRKSLSEMAGIFCVCRGENCVVDCVVLGKMQKVIAEYCVVTEGADK